MMNWLSRRVHMIIPILVLAIAVAGSSVCAATYNIKKIADESTSMPGHGGWVNNFTSFDSPALDNKQVVFVGSGFDHEGVFLFYNDALFSLANIKTEIPGKAGEKFLNFAEPDIEVNDLRGQFCTFLGWRSDQSKQGLYLLDRVTSPFLLSTLSRVADTTTIMPGSNSLTFDTFVTGSGAVGLESGVITFEGANLNFAAQTVEEMGIYQYELNSDTLSMLVSSNDVMPGGSGQTFDGFIGHDGRGTRASFIGARRITPTDIELAVFTRENGGQIETISDEFTAIPIPPPGESGLFTVFSETALSDRYVGFIGAGVNSEGVYVYDTISGSMIKAANNNTVAPGAGSVFSRFSDIALAETSEVAFLGTHKISQEEVDGIYIYSLIDQSLSRIISENEKLDGKTVSVIWFRPQGFDNGDTAFYVRYNDNSEAIYIAEATVNLLGYDDFHTVEIDNRSSCQPRVNLSLGSEGAGITSPLYLVPAAPRESEYQEFLITRQSITHLQLPVESDNDEPVLLYLYDPENRRYIDDPVSLLPGESYNFGDGTDRFLLGGRVVLPGPQRFGAIGLTMPEASESIISILVRPQNTLEPGVITLADSVRLLHVVGEEMTPEAVFQDMNCNGAPDLTDLIKILQIMSGRE